MRAQTAVEVTGPDGWKAHRLREAMTLLDALLPAPGDRLERDHTGVLRITGPTHTETQKEA